MKKKTMEAIEIKGKVNTALCYAKVVEDEAPMAYKSLDDIIDVIKESVDVIDVIDVDMRAQISA